MFSPEPFTGPLLHPRPPTPPREHASSVEDDLGDIIDSLEDSFQVERTLNPPAAPTSFDSTQRTPPSSGDPTTRSDRRTKRVDFSPWSRFHKHNTVSKTTPETAAPVRPLPPSRTLSATKSILKATNFPSPSTSPATPRPRLCSTHQYTSFPEMLEAVLDALASDERDVRLDAYFTLLRTLGAQKNVPEADTLCLNAVPLVQHILRDISAVNATTNAPDSQLTGEACKLLCALMRVPGVTESLNEDTCSAILKKSIVSIEDLNASKAIVRHHMFLLAEQRFPARVMTIERVGRILDVLQTVDERYPGNSVVAMRLLILKRLAVQCPDYMALRISSWLEHIFHGMLSSFDEVRSRGVDAGTTIALSTGHSSDASKALISLFKQENGDSTTYGDYVASRLLAMLNIEPKSEESFDTTKLQQSRHVPQIWAVAILFFRARSDRMTTWSHFKLWLNIISQCFNSSDVQTKFHASVAWNRLVYVLMPSASTERKLYNMLSQPMISQLGTRGLDKCATAVRRYALGSYCNLLHYAFRPSATSQDRSRAWAEYVPPLIQLLSKRAAFDKALKVFRLLMTGERTNMWNENRANEPPFVLELRDLPQIDPHWIRQNVDHILSILGPLLHRFLDGDEGGGASPAMQTWTALLTAVAEAGSKEITASKDFKLAISRLLDFWFNTWPDGRDTINNPSLTARQLAFATSMVEILGPTNFVDIVLKRRVAGQTGQTSFEVVGNPSLYRNRGSVDSALGHIIRFLCATRDTEVEAHCAATAQQLVTVCARARHNNGQDFEALAGCVSDMTSRVKAAGTGLSASDNETEDEAELPRAPRSLSKSPLIRGLPASPAALRAARRSKSPFLAAPPQAQRRTTPKKLRHEDSQIDFAPIQSSPPSQDHAAAESQHLTAHQKEVRERQQEEAITIFSDMSAASPAQVLRGPSVNVNRLPKRPTSASRMQDRLRSSVAEDHEKSNRPSTPPLPLPEVGMSDDIPRSSPVESASERRGHAHHRGGSISTETPPRKSSAVAASFLDLPSSSPPRFDEAGAVSRPGRGSQLVEQEPSNQSEESAGNADTVFDTATEIAEEIIGRSASSEHEEWMSKLIDGGKGKTEEAKKLPLSTTELHEPKVADLGSPLRVVTGDVQASDDGEHGSAVVQQHAPSVPEHGPTAGSSGPEDIMLTAARTEAEDNTPLEQQLGVDHARLPQTISPAPVPGTVDSGCSSQLILPSASPSATRIGATDAVHPVDRSAKVSDSFVAPVGPAHTSQPSSVVSDVVPASQQSLRRKVGRPRKSVKLQHDESIVSNDSQASSASSQVQQKWKFYSNDDSDIEDHIMVLSPDVKHARKRAGKRLAKQPTPARVQTIASRVFGNDKDTPTPVRRSTRSSGSTPGASQLSSPISRKRKRASSGEERRSSRLSQPSPVQESNEADLVGSTERTQPGRPLPSLQVARTPADMPGHGPEGPKSTGVNAVVASTSVTNASGKRKRRESVNEVEHPSEAGHVAVVPSESSRTPVQCKMEPRGETPVSHVRSILSPGGLLRGLRSILDGCRNAVMGSQEEREVDDMLFEIRREVHEAGRRSKKRRTDY